MGDDSSQPFLSALGRWQGWAQTIRGGWRSAHLMDIELLVVDGHPCLIDHDREAVSQSTLMLQLNQSGPRGLTFTATGRRLWPHIVRYKLLVKSSPAGRLDGVQVSMSGLGMSGTETRAASLSPVAADAVGVHRSQQAASQLGDRVASFLRARESGSSASSKTTSVLVQQHGELLAEEYYWGARPEHAQIISSCTKSVTGLLTGIALAETGRSSSEPLLDFLPGREAPSWSEAGITLQHVLDMATGTDWGSPLATTGSSVDMLTSPDLTGFALGHTPMTPPGVRYLYDNSLPCLAGAAIEAMTGTSFPDFAQSRLLDPLQIRAPGWTWIGGNVLASGGMYLRPADMVRIGQLVLDAGEVDGRQVVPTLWIQASSANHSAPGQYPYSNYWHLNDNSRHFRDERAVMALGQGGQAIIAIPGLDAVVVTTSLNWATAQHMNTVWALMQQVILPELRLGSDP